MWTEHISSQIVPQTDDIFVSLRSHSTGNMHNAPETCHDAGLEAGHSETGATNDPATAAPIQSPRSQFATELNLAREQSACVKGAVEVPASGTQDMPCQNIAMPFTDAATPSVSNSLPSFLESPVTSRAVEHSENSATDHNGVFHMSPITREQPYGSCLIYSPGAPGAPANFASNSGPPRPGTCAGRQPEFQDTKSDWFRQSTPKSAPPTCQGSNPSGKSTPGTPWEQCATKTTSSQLGDYTPGFAKQRSKKDLQSELLSTPLYTGSDATTASGPIFQDRNAHTSWAWQPFERLLSKKEDPLSVSAGVWGTPLDDITSSVENFDHHGRVHGSLRASHTQVQESWDRRPRSVGRELQEPKEAAESVQNAGSGLFQSACPQGSRTNRFDRRCDHRCKSSEVQEVHQEQTMEIASLKKQLARQKTVSRVLADDGETSRKAFQDLKGKLSEKQAVIDVLVAERNGRHQTAPYNAQVDAGLHDDVRRLEIILTKLRGEYKANVQVRTLEDKVEFLASKLNLSTLAGSSTKPDAVTARIADLEKTVCSTKVAAAGNYTESQARIGNMCASIDDIADRQRKTSDIATLMQSRLEKLEDSFEDMRSPSDRDARTKSDIKSLANGIQDLTAACERLSEMHDGLKAQVDAMSENQKFEALKRHFQKLLRHIDSYDFTIARSGYKTPLSEMGKILGVEVDLEGYY